jgi:phage tail sheath gpL-like
MKNKALNNAENIIKGVKSGSLLGSVDVHYVATSPVAAAAAVAITHANVTNNDTVTIGNVVITAATSGNGTTSWTIGANATADAVAMAACINANTTLSKIVVATAATGTVTITSVVKGVIGNAIALTTSDATAFGLTAFASGAGGQNGSPTTYT